MERYISREMGYMPFKPLRRNTNIRWNIRVWGMVAVFVILSAMFIRWTEWHTKEVEAAYDAYDQCVRDTYGVTSAEFYQTYGRVANCK